MSIKCMPFNAFSPKRKATSPFVHAGEVLNLTQDQALAVASDADFFPLPVRSGKKQAKITGDTTLDGTYSGKIVRCNHAADISVTLPAAPSAGDNFEVQFGDAADPSKTITIGRNANLIDGEASDLVLTADDDSVLLYFVTSELGWKTVP